MIQTHEVVEPFNCSFPWLVTSILMGGERKKAEKARLRKGVAIVVAAPGRVCDHLRVDLRLPPGGVQAADARRG